MSGIVIGPSMCPHEYFDPKNCRRCTPPADGSCFYCGTRGDHYCPALVARGEEEEESDDVETA